MTMNSEEVKKLVRERYGAKNDRSLLMRTHVQTAGCSLTEQQPLNNIVRVAYQAAVVAVGVGKAEFLLSLLGIASVGIISAGAISKGLLTAALGLFIGMIGFNDVVGTTRATFGLDYLWDGINIIPVVVGLFAFPEIADLVITNTPVAKDEMGNMLKNGRGDTIKGMRIALAHKWLITRSSLIGVFIGAMPGLGPTPAHWIAYAQARQTEAGARETFGTGDIRGVIAPEAANNAATGYQGALDAFNAFRNACGSCSTNFGGESEGSNDVSRGRNCQVCEGYCHISRSEASQLHNQGSCGAGSPNTNVNW